MERIESTGEKLRPTIKDLGRPLDDAEWLSNLVGNVINHIRGKKVKFRRRKTPSVVYLLGKEIGRAVNNNLYILDGCETMSQITERLIDSSGVDRDAARSSLTPKIKRLYTRDIATPEYAPGLWFHDLRAELDDEGPDWSYPVEVVKNELSKFQATVLTKNDIGTLGAGKPPLLLGTLSLPTKEDPISTAVLDDLLERLEPSVTLGPVGPLNAFSKQKK